MKTAIFLCAICALFLLACSGSSTACGAPGDQLAITAGKCDGGICPVEAPRAHASVYQSHRSKSVTRTRTERVRRSGGSSGILQSHGSNGSSRRERRAERRSYGSHGTSFRSRATVSYGSNGGG